MFKKRDEDQKVQESMSQNPEASDHEEVKEEEHYSFLQETFKDEQMTGKKLRNIICKTAGKGLIFGLAACLAFYAARPWTEVLFSGKSGTVTIPEDEDEDESEKEQTGDGEEGAQTEEAVSYPALTVDNYREMTRALYQVASQANKCVVEVSAVKNEDNWENIVYDDVNSVSGTIVWENALEIIILAPARIMKDAQSLNVTFSDGATYPASLKKQDRNLGMAVFSVERRILSSSTAGQIVAATLGNSNVVGRGDPVIALGKQFGYAGGTGYGIISSVKNRVTVSDGEYRLLTTDIAAAPGGSGVLFNTNGEVIGIIDQTITDNESMNLVTAYAVSDLKQYIEQLSNGKAIPYLGIKGVEVPDSVSEENGLPEGIY
ncbi:MAG: S1C family serine protease, partial [Bariatricus sp.]